MVLSTLDTIFVILPDFRDFYGLKLRWALKMGPSPIHLHKVLMGILKF